MMGGALLATVGVAAFVLGAAAFHLAVLAVRAYWLAQDGEVGE